MGCLPGRSIIPGGIPGGIPPISGGIPPGINLGSQVGLAGSRLTFLPGCEQHIKDFVRTKGCFRVAAYKSLDNTIQPLEPPRDCSSFCSSICKCAGESCDAETLPFAAVEDRDSNRTKRAVLLQRCRMASRSAAE